MTKALRSKRYLAASKGATCKFRILGVCNGDWSTVVPCHLHDGHAGGAIKASDISVADGCFACHDVMDRRAKMPNGQHISELEWRFYALRGLQETLEARIEAKVLGWPADAERPPKVKSEHRKGQSPKIATRPMQNSKRPIPHRPFPKRGTTP